MDRQKFFVQFRNQSVSYRLLLQKFVLRICIFFVYASAVEARRKLGHVFTGTTYLSVIVINFTASRLFVKLGFKELCIVSSKICTYKYVYTMQDRITSLENVLYTSLFMLYSSERIESHTNIIFPFSSGNSYPGIHLKRLVSVY